MGTSNYHIACGDRLWVIAGDDRSDTSHSRVAGHHRRGRRTEFRPDLNCDAAGAHRGRYGGDAHHKPRTCIADFVPRGTPHSHPSTVQGREADSIQAQTPVRVAVGSHTRILWPAMCGYRSRQCWNLTDPRRPERVSSLVHECITAPYHYAVSEQIKLTRRKEALDMTFAPGVDPPEHPTSFACWFAFSDRQLLVWQERSVTMVPCAAELAEIGVLPVATHYLGRLKDRDCYAVELAPDAAPPHRSCFEGVRSLYGRLDDEQFALAGRAVQIVEWGRTHRYCGHCATPTVPMPGERAKRCPKCGLTSYPRLSPAVIVLVHRGREVLLARAHNFPAAFYSILAGFVEPGESLEEALAREVREEVGIEVDNITYFGSQPWPFPNSLMIGFTARYAGGEVQINGHELVDAGWFRADCLPEIPPKLSIARRLIDSWVAAHSTG